MVGWKNGWMYDNENKQWVYESFPAQVTIQQLVEDDVRRNNWIFNNTDESRRSHNQIYSRGSHYLQILSVIDPVHIAPRPSHPLFFSSLLFLAVVVDYFDMSLFLTVLVILCLCPFTSAILTSYCICCSFFLFSCRCIVCCLLCSFLLCLLHRCSSTPDPTRPSFPFILHVEDGSCVCAT